MKFAQMCELPTDSAVTQTASSVPLSQSGDENWRGTGAEKRRPLSKKERGEGGWKRGAECVCMCVYVGVGAVGGVGEFSSSLSRGRKHYIK